MKKLFSGKFLIIIAACLVVLIGLGLGAFYLFDDDDAKFVKSGYVLNPLSEASEKYFFDKDAGYRENLSSMVEFVDVDKNEVSILADSFLHYDDESLSFLRNGAILDLDSIDGEGAVKFYNITSASIIEREDSKYLIKAKNGDITLDNFMGRINDNKYIVVGDLQLKLTGNTNTIKGEYFEIVYVEEGVVNIENREVKYQVMADGTTIRVGNDMIIDLGDKKITVKDKDIMSITAITIDGNENVEIIPTVEVEEKPDGEGDDIGNGEGNGTGGNGTGDGNGDGDGNGNGNGAGDGQGGTGQTGKPVENDKEIIVTLKDATIGSTSIFTTFDIMNAGKDDAFTLQVVNLSTGRTVDMVASVVSDVEIKVNLLSPNTKYLFTVVNTKDNNKYFQKIFETAGFGIKLDKMYATADTIAYKVTIDEGTDITNAKLALYKYNEETKQNEIVTSSFYDTETETTVSIPKVTNISTTEGNVEGEYEIIYDGLESNTIYTAVLDEFSVASSNFKDIYNITLTSMTLKKTPEFSKMDVKTNAGAGEFELSVGVVTDPDNAIQKYTYLIYDEFSNELAIDPVVKNNASPLVVKIGEEDNQLQNDTNYYYKVIIEYYDNEKYIEYITSSDITFMMGNDPYVTVVPNDDIISYDKIGGTIYLTDNSCLVSSPGRERCGEESRAVLTVSEINNSDGSMKVIYNKSIEFDVQDNVLKYDFLLEDLQEGTTYNVTVKSVLRNDPKEKLVTIKSTDESIDDIETKTLASLMVNWNTEDYASDSDHVVNLGSQFVVDELNNDGSLSVEDTASSIKNVALRLYEGAYSSGIGNPIATKIYKNTEEINLKEAFYDNMFNVTSDGVFELTIDGLKALNKEGKLVEFYTVIIDAYYDEGGTKKIKLSNNIISYEINKFLLLDNIDTPKMEVVNIAHKNDMSKFPNLTNTGTIIGYKMSAAFDRAGLLQNEMVPQRIHFYVYNSKKRKVNFLVENEDGELELVNSFIAELGESNFFEKKIYINYGTDYHNTDASMARGNEYHIGYEVEVLNGKETEMYPQVGPGKFENYQLVRTEKETPLLTMHITKSTESSISYAYNLIDPDNALYKEASSGDYGMYYIIGATEDEGGVTPPEDGGETGEDNESSEQPDEVIETRNVSQEIKIPLNKVVGEAGSVSTYNGTLTIDNLRKMDLYSLYYKLAITKTSNKSDIKNYFDAEDDGMRLFDGYYDAKDVDGEGNSLYNFKFEVINNQLVDNKVTIKILANEELLNRIVAYRVHFKDSKGNTLDKELWQLTACGDNDEVNRCLSVNYTDLKEAGMKSDKEVENLISVQVDALYDNGLTGYDFVIGEDYDYMIMQNNNTAMGMGSYISFASNGKLTNWSDEIKSPKGYYTYTVNGSRITYKSLSRFNGYSSFISFGKSSSGYLSKNYGVLNPKMISVDQMSYESNVFSFSSITPKIYTSMNTLLINGAILDLRLSGVDLNDVYNEGSKNKPEYYLYVEVWDDLSKVGKLDQTARPVIKGLIDNENAEATVKVTADGLLSDHKYYYNVYAKMYKDNKVEYIQLFDARYLDKYETRTYTFTSKSYKDVFKSLNVSYRSLTEPYGNREMLTSIELNKYDNDVPFNFDLIYVLCDQKGENCGINEGDSNILMATFKKEEVFNLVESFKDISDYNLEFGKNYYLGVYARASYYASNDSSSLTTQDIELNKYNSVVPFDKLSEPTYTIKRNALVTDDGKYAVDLKVTVTDANRTIINGKYFVKFVDATGKVVGEMQLLDEEGNYYNVSDYTKHEFDATVANQMIRITGLKPDTKYFVIAEADAFLNNYDEADIELTEEEKRVKRTIKTSKSHTVYSVNDYGVAFGRDLLYSATARSIVVTFLGGSNFENVTKVRYTVGLWDGPSDSSTLSGVYDLVENPSKKFEISTNNEDPIFVIDPTDMKNTLNATYEVNLSFEVKHGEEFIWLTSADNASFEGKVKYVEK